MIERRVLREVLLVSDSKKRAQYKLTLFALADGEGFVVSKESGAAGAIAVTESWYRANLEQAELKFALIVRKKTARSAGRRYYETSLSTSEQLDLLSAHRSYTYIS